MSLKTKFFIEVIVLVILFSLIPAIWLQFYFNPLKEKYVASVDKLVSDLVDMPKQTVRIDDYRANENTNPPGGIVQKFIFKTNFDENIYRWMEEGSPVQVVVDPNFGPIGNNPLELHVYFRGSNKAKMRDSQFNYDPDKFSLRILKDQRAVSAVNSFNTQSMIETKIFTQQPDGLRDIQVANTDTKDYFGYMNWKFDQDKLPYNINENAKKIDIMSDKSYLLIFIPHSLKQLLYFAASSGTGYLTYILRNILLPFSIISLLSYFLSQRIFKRNDLLKLNLVFLILAIILYPISNFISFFLLILSYYFITGQTIG